MSLYDRYATEVATFTNVCHQLAARLYVTAHGGNLAWRLDDDVVLITPTKLNKGEISAGDLVFIDLAGNTLEGTRKPTGEKPMYLRFFADRPDVVSVLHCHAPSVGAFAIMGGKEWLMRPFYPETCTEVGPVPTVPFGEPLTDALADAFVPYLQRYNSFLMANHGLVTMTAGDIEWTFMNVTLLEVSAQSLLAVLAAGEPRELTRDQVAGLDNIMHTRGLPFVGAPDVNTSLVDLYFG